MVNEIIAYAGGRDNITDVDHCMSRLRLSIKDYHKVDMEALKGLNGVLGVVNEGTLQVVVGPGQVRQLYNELTAALSEEQLNAEDRPEVKPTTLKNIAHIFIPLLPALIGSGFINAVNSLLKLYMNHHNSSEFLTTISTFLTLTGSGFISFLLIFVGINAAKEFHLTQIIGGTLAGIVILPQVTQIHWAGLHLLPGMGGIFTILFIVWIASFIERWCYRLLPDLLVTMLSPTITILLSSLLLLLIVMPVAALLSNAIIFVIEQLMTKNSIILGFVMAIIHLPLVLLGLHHGLMPIHMELINSLGYTPLYPLQQMAGVSLIGAGFAILLRTRSANTRRITRATLPTMVMGIGEPIIYSLFLPMFRPFVTAIIGGGIAGAFLASHKLGLVAIGVPYFASWSLVYGGSAQIIIYLTGIMISLVCSFILTYFLGYNESLDGRLMR